VKRENLWTVNPFEPLNLKERTMKKRKQALWILLLLIPILATGCAGTQDEKTAVLTNGYKALSAAAATYDVAFQSLADLYVQGAIDEAAKTKAIEYGSYFWAGYHMAVEALESYQKTGSLEDQEALSAALAEVSRLLGVFLGYVEPLLN